MKKCSTAALALSLALTVFPACADTGKRCAFIDTAPDSHRVVRGDTLWDIAATFLADPWCWPEVWAPNRDAIRDPHRIYPGQVIVFDRRQRRLDLATDAHDAGDPLPEQRSPAARSEPVREAPIPAIDPSWQRAADELRLLPAAGGSALPRILGFSESRRIAAAGDIALVDGGLAGPPPAGSTQEVVRRLPPIIDPDDGRVLAAPLQQVGRATFLRPGEQGILLYRIVAVRGELLDGDLLASPSAEPPAPAATADGALRLHPAPALAGRVAAILSGGRWAAQRDLVALNRGSGDGLGPGSLVSVVRQVRIAAHDARNPPPAAPAKAVATLVVLQALERVSLALVLRSTDAFSVGESVQSVQTDAP